MATEAPLSPMMEFLGKMAYELALVQPFLPTYIHLLASALFPIYIGAHASLSRPDSAAKSESRRHSEHGSDDLHDEDDDDEEQKMEGLSPGDAILFPLMAGTTTAGLYFLIKWLGDPALLNMLMNGYLALMGVYSVGRLVGDSLNTAISFIFPRAWKEGGNVIRVDKHEKETFTLKEELKLPRGPSSPLPGAMSKIKLSARSRTILWTIRGLFTENWTLTIRWRGKSLNKTRFGLNDVLGIVSGALVVLAYNFISKTWPLTNLLGFGFSYIALQFMSPTTFWTGTLILFALFFYDIYFVFFTPVMVTVATSLDVPIKLLFPRPAGPDADPTKEALAMLGLGDIVIPGIMVGLAIRYDLHLHYLRKQNKTLEDAETKSPEALETPRLGASEKPRSDPSEAFKSESRKPVYSTATGLWGERFWLYTGSTSPDSELFMGGQFSKTYFHASLLGYVLGMLATFIAMHISNHPQPALLYLVPGVLGALWGTSLVRGEVSMMWNFSEAVDEEANEDIKGKTGENDEAVEKQKEASGTKSTVSENENADKKAASPHHASEDETSKDKPSEKKASKHTTSENSDAVEAESGKKVSSASNTAEPTQQDHSKLRQIFSLTITAPPIPTHPLHGPTGTVATNDETVPSSLDTNGIPVEKRRRI